MNRPLRALLALGLLARAGVAQEAEARKLAELLAPSVVRVGHQEGYGSGIILDEKGLILTNAHVLVSPTPVSVLVEGAAGPFEKVTLLGVHPTKDLALLRIDPSERRAKLVPIKIAKARALAGDRLYAMGYPSTRGGRVKVLTVGKMVGHDRFEGGPGYDEFLGDIHPGNSGGPVCTREGEAIGVVTLTYLNGSGRSFAIPITDLKIGEFVPLAQRPSNPANASRILGLAEQALAFAREHRGLFADLAEELFMEALLEDFSNPDIHYKIGLCCRNQGAYPKAAAYLVRSLRLKPWPDSGALLYHELGVALVKIDRKEEALAVWREGVAKYPTEGGPVWDALAIYYYQSGDYLEAAVASRAAIRAFGDRGGVMNETYKESRSRLSVETLGRLRAREEELQGDFEKLKAASDKARKAGAPFITPECEKLVRSYEGATRELGVPPSGPSRPAASTLPKIADPWQGHEAGEWYRFRTSAGGKDQFEDVGLKKNEASSDILFKQRYQDGQSSPAEEVLSKHAAFKIVGEESLEIQDRVFACEIRSPLGEGGAALADEREWVIKGGKYAGAVLKVESPRRTLSTKQVWDHVLRIKGREFDCVVVEAESRTDGRALAIKTWYCTSVPFPLRIEGGEKSVTLVTFGPNWSERPAFSGSGKK